MTVVCEMGERASIQRLFPSSAGHGEIHSPHDILGLQPTEEQVEIVDILDLVDEGREVGAEVRGGVIIEDVEVDAVAAGEEERWTIAFTAR